MDRIESISTASDRVLEALISGLEIEFGHGAGEALAQRFLEAEEVDFHWEARRLARWIGDFEGEGADDLGMSEVRIFGRLNRKWFVAAMIVDGEGTPYGMMGKRTFGREHEALKVFMEA